MARLRKPTETIRATVAQEARYILWPEEDAPEGSVRRVQVLVAGGDQVNVGIDVEIQHAITFQKMIEDAAAAIPDGAPEPEALILAQDELRRKIGPNRTYTVPLFPPGRGVYPFKLQPTQWVTAMADAGIGYITLIVEYLEAD